jgi:hypothetical protein
VFASNINNGLMVEDSGAVFNDDGQIGGTGFLS